MRHIGLLLNVLLLDVVMVSDAAVAWHLLLILNPLIVGELPTLELAGGVPGVLGLPGRGTDVFDPVGILEDGRDLLERFARGSSSMLVGVQILDGNV